MKRLFFPALLTLVVACSSHRVTQYVGSAMNAATPEAEGSLRLTLYSRTDTSFTGVIELGAPMRGTGGAFAWFEGSELHVVTVGAQSGDTINWYSPLTDAGLGGRFNVTGGPRTGQRGTWRANLVAGLPAAEATLRTPRSVPLPAPLALWPVFALTLVALIIWRWILAAPRGTTIDGTRWRAPHSRLSGIGGWLLLFVIGRSLSLLVLTPQFTGSLHTYARSIGLSTAVPGLQPLIVLETAVALLNLPLTLVGLVLLARRSPHAPRFWFAFISFMAAYLFIDVGAMHLIRPGLERFVGTTAHWRTSGRGSPAFDLEQAGVALLWALYWARSRRVRATFGAAALDRTVTAPPAAIVPLVAIPAPEMASASRRWRRIVFHTAGVLLVIVIPLLVYGFWVSRPTPYDVARGADIRAVVAGRWRWDSDTAGCRDAHTIAFGDGGKVMTITSGDIGKAEPTTYDILRVTRSSIQGAIRGEKRLTKQGKPVVWDLVLTGPNEYRWRRTDWTLTPWSYTGKIRRCPAAPPAAEARPLAR